MSARGGPSTSTHFAIALALMLLSVGSHASAQPPDMVDDLTLDVRLEAGSGPMRLWVSDARAYFSGTPDDRHRLVCIAPCTTRTAPGTFRFTAQAPGDESAPFASEVVRVDEAGDLFLRFEDHRSARELGVGVITAGIVLILAGVAAAGLGALLVRDAEPYVVSGLIAIAAGLGATVVAFWFATEEDRIALRFAPREP